MGTALTAAQADLLSRHAGTVVVALLLVVIAAVRTDRRGKRDRRCESLPQRLSVFGVGREVAAITGAALTPVAAALAPTICGAVTAATPIRSTMSAIR